MPPTSPVILAILNGSLQLLKANLFSLLNIKLNDLVPYVLLSSFLNCGGNARSFTGTSKGINPCLDMTSYQ